MFSVTVGLGLKWGRRPAANALRTSRDVSAPELVEHVITTVADLLLNAQVRSDGFTSDVVVNLRFDPPILTEVWRCALLDALIAATKEKLLGGEARQLLDDLPIALLPEDHPLAGRHQASFPAEDQGGAGKGGENHG